ncbi:MAG: RNA-guided endonuclease InsQ/TnpB family protein [Dermatophilaceae bacterium]
MRFRLYPTPAQEVLPRQQCGHARYVWNLGLEQRLMWVRWKGPTPGYVEQCRQLTEARAAQSWLAAGSQTVQQQALRDLDQGWRNFFAGTHDRPTWRKRGTSEGLRIVGPQALRVRRDNGRWSSALVPKVGWVPFRRTRALVDWKSYRINRDRAGRWHLAFAAVPEPIPGPGTGQVVGVDRFGHRDNADVNAAPNIAERAAAAGLAVAARGDRAQLTRSVKREPQLVAS